MEIYISIIKDQQVIFQRIKNGLFEFNLSIFLDYDKADPTDIESTLHIYFNRKKQHAYYGTLLQMEEIIRETKVPELNLGTYHIPPIEESLTAVYISNNNPFKQ